MIYVLILVTMLADGTIVSEKLDTFKDPTECYDIASWELEVAEPEVGFVCIRGNNT